MNEIEDLKKLVADLYAVHTNAAENDDAAVGYKHRERVLNRARVVIGIPEEEIPDGWRE